MIDHDYNAHSDEKSKALWNSIKPEIKGGQVVTIWITRGVLESGRIIKTEGHRCHGSPNLVNSNMETYSDWKKEYHLDEGTAKLHAEHLRVEALRKARAEVERLERMEF